jgi:hypothetical protein
MKYKLVNEFGNTVKPNVVIFRTDNFTNPCPVTKQLWIKRLLNFVDSDVYPDNFRSLYKCSRSYTSYNTTMIEHLYTSKHHQGWM